MNGSMKAAPYGVWMGSLLIAAAPIPIGVIRAVEQPTLEHPAIRPNYLSTPGDRAVAADAIRLTRRIMATPTMQQFEPEEYLPGGGSDDQLALERAAGDIGTTIFHPVAWEMILRHRG